MSAQLLARFIPEARDLLQTSASGLLKLERDPHDADAINEVFRAVHTLKGSSGLFDVIALTKLVHAAEDLLSAIRADEIELDSQLVDMLLDSLDQVGHWIDHLEQHDQLPPEADGKARDLGASLRAYGVRGELQDEAPKAATPADASGQVSGPHTAEWLNVFSEIDRLAAFRRTGPGVQILAVRYDPPQDCFFRGEDPVNLIRQIPDRIAHRIEPRLPWEPLAELDPFRCNLRFSVLSAAPRAEIEHLFRYIPEQIEIHSVAASSLIHIDGKPVDRDEFAELEEEAERLMAAGDYGGLRALTDAKLRELDPSLYAASALRWVQAALACETPDYTLIKGLLEAVAPGVFGDVQLKALQAIKTHLPQEQRKAPPPALSELAQRIIVAQRYILDAPAFDEVRLTSAVAVLRNMLTHLKLPGFASELDEIATAARSDRSTARLLEFADHLSYLKPPLWDADRPNRTKGTGPPSSADIPLAREPRKDGHAAGKTLKVDESRIDELMNLIGELVVSKNSLPFLAKRAEEVHGSRELSREIRDQHAVMDRLAQEMQGSIMQVRMLPVSEVFSRFPRLVRDIARKLNKSVELVLEGEETAADKTIIEALGDPLMHIVRNSLDHGIEPPEERVEAGKPGTAQLVLRAYQEADQVVIAIVDDGRGIDAGKIRAAAIEKGVIEADKAAQLNEQEAINLIFAPGFSTAKEISDLSGRGVGMDVVKSTIQKLGGRVTLNSRLGEGTELRLSLPLSMAVTRIMMIEGCGSLYGIPMDLIVETVRVPADEIRTIKNAETFILRDQIIPLIRMPQLLREPCPETQDGRDAPVLVCRVNGSNVGIVVDDFRERMEVILKPLQGILAGLRGYSGTALLGDGRVLLVLDLKELI